MENKLIITTENTCDLPKSFIDKASLPIIPLSFTIDGKDYKGDAAIDVDYHDFYAKMRSGSMPQTGQITPDAAERVFESYIKNGYDVIHIAFSSALSGSYNSARMAAEEIKTKYPECKIAVIDSLCASLGEGLLIYYALKMRDEGRDFDYICSWLENNKLKLCHNFTVDDLFHLHRGGRVSKTAAIVGSLLGVKPVLHVDNAGRLVPVSKVRGRKQSLTALVDNMGKKIDGIENEIVFISHGDCIEDAEFVKNLVAERFGIKNFIINYVGPVIGAHSGPGTIALFFFGNER